MKKDEIEALSWTKVPRGCQLSVRRKGGPTVNFLGFRDKVRCVNGAAGGPSGCRGLGRVRHAGPAMPAGRGLDRRGAATQQLVAA